MSSFFLVACANSTFAREATPLPAKNPIGHVEEIPKTHASHCAPFVDHDRWRNGRYCPDSRRGGRYCAIILESRRTGRRMDAVQRLMRITKEPLRAIPLDWHLGKD
jgi:hypothetical protein